MIRFTPVLLHFIPVFAALSLLVSAGSSKATPVTIGIDPTGSADTFIQIGGAIVDPVVLDFQLTLNAIYGSDPNPSGSISGSLTMIVMNQFGVPTNLLSASGMVFAGDIGNSGDLTNTTHFLVNVDPSDLSIRIDVFAILQPVFATFKPVLSVELPPGLVLEDVATTPLPAAFALFATGIGILGGVVARRKGQNRLA